ncbi:cation:proton antiporter [Ornithinimicrobium cerasi]|uniref:cation:proton antiporter n=1 Tax=Ornithinimicrobium cerasi TaxID=2248773 RepID=UPI000F002112|nr:monovalent cation/H(+) antiporter subunit G [Ornithinimicrobium cerasi]
MVVTVIVGLLCLTGALFVLVSAVAMMKARDGLSRINVLSAATGLGMPLIVAGALVQDVATNGFDWVDLVKALIAVLGFVIMSSVASNNLGRAAYRSGAPIDPATRPNELAEEPRTGA